MTKVLGLDVSSASTGYAVVSDGYLDFDSLGTIQPPTKLMMGEKLMYFEKALKRLLKKHRPDVVVVEEVFRGPNAKTFRVLAMFKGVAYLTIRQAMHYDPIAIMPTEARKAVGVSGSKKEDAFAWVVERFGFVDYTFAKHNDICDGIVLALSYFYPATIKPAKKRKAK
jgi:crossover junction endodeoxyribonuclease RuvC